MRALSRLVCLAVLLGSVESTRADEGPALVVPSITVQLYRVNGYAKTPKGPQDPGTWSWTPRVTFQVVGAIPEGSVYTVEFLSGQKPWLTLIMKDSGGRRTAYPPGTTELEGGMNTSGDSGVTTSGPVPFQIRLKNELVGVDKVVFKGTMTVKKVFVKDEPAKKNTYEYYADRDGDLPIGYLWSNTTVDKENPALYGGLWLRGELQGDAKPTFHLMHDGKPVCSPKEGGMAEGFSTGAGQESEKVTWNFVIFSFTECARTTAAHTDYGLPPNAIVLDKNPGDYEVKVLRAGKLSRVMKFTVGADGKIVDSGIAAKAGLGVSWAVLPVQIQGDTDAGQKFDKNAWKTGALYGNPLPAFSP